MRVLMENCTGCRDCQRICPFEAVAVKGKKAQIAADLCTECGTCFKVCRFQALEKEEKSLPPGTVVCHACPVYCRVSPGKTGSCHRFRNEEGRLRRSRSLVPFDQVEPRVARDFEKVISKPLLTAIGAGTTAPCYKPAPYIVQDRVEGVDVVTCVTECIFTYSSMEVKVDTDLFLGEEGRSVIYRGKEIGSVSTAGYGFQKLSLGGPSIITGGTPKSFFAIQAITDLANRRSLKLKIKGGGQLELQVGKPPLINQGSPEKMRFGCGGATVNLLGRFFKGAADEVICIDYTYTGLFSELPFVRRDLGIPPSGIELTLRRNSPGRYFGEMGYGWGQSKVNEPLDIIRVLDPKTLKNGMTILVTEPTGSRAKFYFHLGEGKFEERELPPAAREAIQVLAENVEKSRVSALYIGGAGGSARGGISRQPLKLTEAIRDKKARLTVGGAGTFIYPGGGITFAVDVEEVLADSFSWVPSPAVVAPIEYTLKREDYLAIGGHEEFIRPLREVLDENRRRPFEVSEEGW